MPGEPLQRLPRVGDWFSCCCEEDLCQIDSAEELAHLVEDARESGTLFFATREDGVIYFTKPIEPSLGGD